MKKRKLKNWVSFTLFYINIILIMLDFMLIAELNKCYLFYSLSINVVFLNAYIINKYSSKQFIKNTNLFSDEEK